MKPNFAIENNLPRAIYDAPYESLGFFLEQDVQSSIGTCDHYLSEARACIAGRTEKYEGVGNAFYVLITPDVVEIVCEYEESLFCRLGTSAFVEQLEFWREFCIRTRPRKL